TESGEWVMPAEVEIVSSTQTSEQSASPSLTAPSDAPPVPSASPSGSISATLGSDTQHLSEKNSPPNVTSLQRRAILKSTGEPVLIGPIEKMSKSKKNTIDPDDIMSSYGADVARWFMLSDSPPERDVEWTERGVQGAWRFTQRLWRL